MTNQVNQIKVSKIAIINPYLQRGLTESSEVEGTMRFVTAAKRLGIEATVITRSEQAYEVKPDFVLALSYQEPKLTHYPTYGSLPVPLNWFQNSPRFMRNILSYDGYLVPSPIVLNWLQQLCKLTNKVLHATDAAFSVPKTVYTSLDFSRAKAVYMGVNWDGLRHHELFQHFENGEYLKCFGPKDSWARFPAHLYGGMIPFDGFSVLQAYAAYGVGLCINHPDFDRDGAPSCRTFEIAAASAVAICAKNQYTLDNYGDSVLYVDQNLKTKELAESIKEKIEWIRSHPSDAKELAKSSHEIFSKKLSQEYFIEKIINMHEKVMNDYGYAEPREKFSRHMLKEPKVTYLIHVDNINTVTEIIKDILDQSYKNYNIILLINKNDQALINSLKPSENSNIYIFPYGGPSSNSELMNFMRQYETDFFAILKNDDQIYSNHVAFLLQSYINSDHDKKNESEVIIFSNSLEHSNKIELRDKIQDPHMIYLASYIRVGNLTPCTAIPLCAVLFKFNQPMINAFKDADLMSNLKIDYATSTNPVDVAIHANGITCSSSIIDLNKSKVIIIQNATSPVNFLNQMSTQNGALLVDERTRQKELQTTV